MAQDRWERLFAELEAQAEVELRTTDVDVPDKTRQERSEVTLTDRLRASSGRTVTLVTSGAGAVRGVVRDVGPQWLLLGGDRPSSLCVVPTSAVLTAEGVARHAVPARPASVSARLSLRAVLRSVARDRSPVRLSLTDGRVLSGTVDEVGHDHLDLAVHPMDEPRRAVQQHVVALAAIAMLRPAEGTSSLAW
ncbi:MAG TPA: hypothetical protein VFL94_05210 [Actinomycetales bacterium]|nr:hypothetical protein [Actinomycetales bacterium]